MIRYIYALIALALIWLAGCMSQPRPSYDEPQHIEPTTSLIDCAIARGTGELA
jgi:hypothetical protein